MSIRAKFHLLVFVAFPVGFFVLGVLGKTVHLVFAFLALAYVALIGTLTFLVRCPGCNTLIATQGYFMVPYIPRRCRSCGYDLGKRRQRNEH